MSSTLDAVEASIAESERYLQDRESRLSSEFTVRVDSLDVSPVGRSLTDERNSTGCSVRNANAPCAPRHTNGCLPL
ncbi:hypothetical protein FOZ62_018411 [Perkinsus olseni]|uniref:Uncharacterized protein n=1 Tax=Perkinsus olseni TaxID=32597 RepID=A0A7J6R0P2_PEROL|nr:hypothetical protein FOZ62_018411 [Perkinsus olseni]